jgi:HEAT repeat protein
MMGGRSGPAVPRLIKIYGKEPDSDVGEEVKQALQEIVPSATDVAPALIAALRSDQQPVRLLAVELLNTADDPQPATASLQALLDDADAGIRIRAAIALQRLGQSDTKVLNALVASLSEEKENYEASDALRAEGRKIALLLVERLVDPKSTAEQRLRAVRIFEGVDQPGKAALAALTKALGSDVPDVRSCSALALTWRSQEDPATADPALIKSLEAGLKSTNLELRRECAQTLGRTRAPAAVAPLMALLRQDKELRDQAAYSLSQLPRDEKTVTQLIKLLNAPKTRSAAARALSNLREHQDTAARALIAVFTGAEQEERDVLGHTLQSLGKPAVTQLVALFEAVTVKEEIRLAALALVGHMREDARDVAPKLEKYLKDRNHRVRVRVAITLAFLETDADVAGLLLDAIEKDDDSLRSDAQSALGTLGIKGAKSVDHFIGWLKGPDADRRNIAINALSSVGRDSPKALSALVTLLKSSEDQNVRRSATYALSAFEDRGTAELIKALADPAYSRLDVLTALRQLGQRAKAAREPVVKLLGDKDRSVAIAAAIALASIDPKTEAVPVLIEGMRSSDRDIRNQATSALGNFGPLARTAVPELIRVLQTQDTRYSALYALGRIGPDAVAAVDVLARLLNSRDAYSAATALGAIGPTAAPAIPRLLRMLQNERTALAAAAALSKIGGDAKQAVPLLVARLGDNDHIVPACQALAHVGHLDLDRALSALRKVASNPDPEIRAVAVSALGQLKSPKAMEDLLTALKDPELSVRLAAVSSLGQQGSEAEPAVAKLTEVLEAKELALRNHAAWALGNIGSKAAGAVPALVKALSDKETRRSAIYALGRIGTGAGAAVPQLVELLDNPELRYEAAYALGQMGPAAKAALPKLMLLAKDGDPPFAKAARAAADRIEGKAVPPDDDRE